MIKSGDTVFHKPTGETWLVAYADKERDEIAWCGWPPGTAKLSDCVLTGSCEEEESLEMIQKLAAMNDDREGYDHLKSWAINELKKRAELLTKEPLKGEGWVKAEN